MPASPISRVLAVLGAIVLVQGCTSWKNTGVAPRQAVESGPGHVQLTLASGAKVEVFQPVIVHDTVMGESPTHERVAVPLSLVRSVGISQFSGGKTLALVMAAGVTAVLVVAAIGSSPKPAPPPPPPTTSVPQTFSCPLVYSWDGEQWRLDSGTFGGAITQGLQRTDVDNLAFATAANGLLRLRVTNELSETDHIDALEVIAVDHPAAWSPAPDAAGRLHSIGTGMSPLHAVDFAGRDVRARVQAADGWNWESALEQRDTARSGDSRDGIELTFTRPAGAARAHLVLDANNTPWAAYLLGQFAGAHGAGLDAWYDSLDANPAMARATGMRLAREGFLSAAVWTGSRWTPQGLVWEAGPEIGKRQVLELDLSAVTGDTVRIRLESVPSFWLIDRVALDFTADQPMIEQHLTLRSAVDERGRDVRSLIAVDDHQYYTLETGDAAEVVFDAPAPQAGMMRSYILRSSGWYRLRLDAHPTADAALLAAVAGDPLGLSKAATTRRNEALTSLAGRAR